MLRFRRRLYCWIALCAMLLGALAPTLSRALGAGEGLAKAAGFWLEVCSASGNHLVTLSVAEVALYADHAAVPADEGGDGAGVLNACPYCASALTVFDLPHAGRTPVLAAAADRLLPDRFLLSPRPLFAWSAARPRAPPARA